MNEIAEAFTELERGVHAALVTYSYVHLVSSQEVGLSLGVRRLAVDNKALPA